MECDQQPAVLSSSGPVNRPDDFSSQAELTRFTGPILARFTGPIYWPDLLARFTGPIYWPDLTDGTSRNYATRFSDPDHS